MTTPGEWLEYWCAGLDPCSEDWPARFKGWRCHPADDTFSHLDDALRHARALAGMPAQHTETEILGIALCLSHSEAMQDQDDALALLAGLRGNHPGLEKILRERQEVIRQFGRFPARNRPLKRASTPTEAYFVLGAGALYR